MTQRAKAGPQRATAPADGQEEPPDLNPDEDEHDSSDDDGWQPV